ncbi:rhamnogalacturonan acetylesterase [Dyadobacter diqingensis]|uniref:rhamnogalacturonan acetylesterase n=1 Tax=Dyadobacter diqingensis TaxID=2938121 RepID=UPI0020C19C74|nr:rhamnogalacturonan acetylesterase [Dyadobacter diqingensis]
MIKVKFLVVLVVLISLAAIKPSKPTVYLIGDSTVKNGSGKGADNLWGWGTVLPELFDTVRISIQNHAIGGRSSRTFLTEGRWEKVLANLKAGDYVIMQFGHNDGGPVNDTLRARGSIKGLGTETEEIDNLITKKHEIVHTYGWYMRKYINETKAKGAIPIVCSPVPRNIFKDGKIEIPETGYTKWAEQTAAASGAYFIDLFGIVARNYDAMGQDKVKADFFTEKDHTHTTKAGAEVNAKSVTDGIRLLKKCDLKNYLL